jgi:hypothetical protein
MSNHSIYNFSDLHKVEPLPGIYSWWLSFDSDFDIKTFHEFFLQKKFSIEMQGNLNEHYKGDLNQKQGSNIDFNIDPNLLKETFSHFNVPIYIGISKNLKKRLETHSRLLNDKYIDEIIYNKNFYESVASDSDEESTYFAERLASKIKNKFKLNALHVKVIYRDKNYERSNLIKAETYLNRTLFPILGRN